MGEEQHTNENVQPADQPDAASSGQEIPETPKPVSIDLGSSPTTATPSAASESQPAPKPAKPTAGNYHWGTGRRKTAVARVRIRPGDGKFLVNGRPADQYFTEIRDHEDINAPLRQTKTEGSLDVFVNVRGGGFHGQAGAVLLGLSRALKNYDPTLEPILRDHDFLTRDPREVERKKYGQRGARRRFQFSKR